MLVGGILRLLIRIDVGISDIDFKFAEGSGIVIDVDGGLLDKDFEGFSRKNGKWYSEGFIEGGDNIEIWFEGGVSDLENFYVTMNRDMVMGYLVAELFEVWGNYTIGPFVYYSHASIFGRYGSWGIYESLYDGESEKSKVVEEWRDAYI